MRAPQLPTKDVILRLASGVLLVVVLGACVSQPPATATPQAAPTAPGPTFPPMTPEPTVPAFNARDIRIDIDAGDYQVKGMQPNHTIQLPWAGSPYGLIIHYPFPVRPYTVYPAITDPRSVTWTLEIVQPPDANSLAFILSGANLGFFNVAIQLGDSRPVRFQVQVMGDGTPIPPAPTPASPTTLQQHDDRRDASFPNAGHLSFNPLILPAQKPYARVIMS